MFLLHFSVGTFLRLWLFIMASKTALAEYKTEVFSLLEGLPDYYIHLVICCDVFSGFFIYSKTNFQRWESIEQCKLILLTACCFLPKCRSDEGTRVFCK